MTCRQKKVSLKSRGFFSAIAGIFLRDRGDFPRDRGDFFPRFFPTEGQNDSPFWRAGCDETDANRYSGPPRRPDEVLDPMRSPPPCRMQRSFERHMDTKIRSVPWRWTGSNSLPESHDPCDSEIAGAVWTADAYWADCLADSPDCQLESAD